MAKFKKTICMSCGKMRGMNAQTKDHPCRKCRHERRKFEIERMERERTGQSA